MIVLENPEQKEVLLLLLSGATVQGIENAKKLLSLYESLSNAILEVTQDKKLQ